MKPKTKNTKCKKEQLNTKKNLLKKCEIIMSGQGFLILIGLKALVMKTSLQNIVNGYSRPHDVDGMIKLTRLQNTVLFILTFLQPIHFY